MPIDDAFQAGTDAVLADMVQRPQAPKPQPPRFSMWSTLTAAPRGIAAGAAEAVGSTADVMGAFGSVLATTEASAGGMFSVQTPDERKQAQAATAKLLKDGPDYMTGAGRNFRNVAHDYMPDPVTAHGAEVAVGELFRVGSKALTAAALIGPVPGAMVSGVEEGFTTADKLAGQGVDKGTRTAVGAVTAAVQAATFALPVAGSTWGQTAGLALAGGPVAFIAQQSATREILQRQDYAKLAEQYDPFDPVGLTLSTLIPLGFGAIAMRAGRKAVTAEPPVKAPTVDDAAVDAARTALLSENLTTTRPVDAADLAGSAQHEQAYSRALDQMAAGERVDVSDLAPVAGAERILSDMGARLEQIGKAVAESEPPQALGNIEQAAIKDVAKAGDPPTSIQPEKMDISGDQAGKVPSESPQLDARSAEIEAANPQMMVQLEGMDAPAPLSEVMARVRQEVAADLAEAPLIEAAANCFLRNP